MLLAELVSHNLLAIAAWWVVCGVAMYCIWKCAGKGPSDDDLV